SRSAVSALRSWDRIGMAASNAGDPCSVKSPTAWAMPCIFNCRSMMTIAPFAGLSRMANLRLSQGIVSFDIGLGLIGERQGLRCVEGRRVEGFAIDEAMQQVQHMRLGRNTGLQRHVDG